MKQPSDWPSLNSTGRSQADPADDEQDETRSGRNGKLAECVRTNPLRKQKSHPAEEGRRKGQQTVIRRSSSCTSLGPPLHLFLLALNSSLHCLIFSVSPSSSGRVAVYSKNIFFFQFSEEFNFSHIFSPLFNILEKMEMNFPFFLTLVVSPAFHFHLFPPPCRPVVSPHRYSKM